MLINLTDVLSCDGKVVKRTVETELKSFDTDLGHFPLSEEEPLALTLTNLGKDKLLIEGSTKLKTVIPCDRCLTDVETLISLSISREVDMQQTAEGRIEDLDETDFIIGYNLDTEKLVYHVTPLSVHCIKRFGKLCSNCLKTVCVHVLHIISGCILLNKQN